MSRAKDTGIRIPKNLRTESRKHWRTRWPSQCRDFGKRIGNHATRRRDHDGTVAVPFPLVARIENAAERLGEAIGKVDMRCGRCDGTAAQFRHFHEAGAAA